MKRYLILILLASLFVGCAEAERAYLEKVHHLHGLMLSLNEGATKIQAMKHDPFNAETAPDLDLVEFNVQTLNGIVERAEALEAPQSCAEFQENFVLAVRRYRDVESASLAVLKGSATEEQKKLLAEANSPKNGLQKQLNRFVSDFNDLSMKYHLTEKK